MNRSIGQRHELRVRRAGFTLVELLVAIAIIAVLITLLIPTVGRIRRAAQVADTQALIAKLQNAIERYNQDFGAYPGPLPDSFVGSRGASAVLRVVGTASNPNPPPITQTTPSSVPVGLPSNPAAQPFVSITGAENLVLGLLGGLVYNPSPVNPGIEFDPTRVGRGPASLNPAALKPTSAYIEPANLSAGLYVYESVHPAGDSIIPEFVDRFPDPMPILYFRAKRGATGIAGYGPAGTATNAQYDLAHNLAYTASMIGLPRTLGANQRRGPTGGTTAGDGRNAVILGTHGLRDVAEPAGSTVWDKTSPNYRYPFDLSLYASDPSNRLSPRARDTYLLIAAGPDRIYGTADDITSFGQVLP